MKTARDEEISIYGRAKEGNSHVITIQLNEEMFHKVVEISTNKGIDFDAVINEAIRIFVFKINNSTSDSLRHSSRSFLRKWHLHISFGLFLIGLILAVVLTTRKETEIRSKENGLKLQHPR